VEPSSKISITFSKGMDKTSVQAAFRVSPDMTGTFSWNGNVMIFTPSMELLPDTSYTVKITTDAKDLHGNVLEAEYSFSFTTKGAKSSATFDLLFYLISLIAIIAVILVLIYIARRRKRPERAPGMDQFMSYAPSNEQYPPPGDPPQQ
jgi:ATP-dependent Zn protease